MAYLEGVIAMVLQWGKLRVLSLVGMMMSSIAVADWAVGNRFSLGLLYILPTMLAAIVLAPWQIPIVALICSMLRLFFDVPSLPLEVVLRFIFAFLAYSGAGFFVMALIRNRELEEQIRTLVESSPAAILTADGSGSVLAANRAANALFLIPGRETLKGKRIQEYVPLLRDALPLAGRAEGFRTAAQCQGRRRDGEIFQAHIWFSSYLTSEGPRLAAIIVDSSEEMRDREEQGLQQLMMGNRIAAAAVSHEVRNLCGAISLLCSNIRIKHGIAEDDDFQGLTTLVGGLERIASWELQNQVQDSTGEISLQEVLDDLRIVIESDWREIDGTIIWKLPSQLPVVLAERHELLQAFLNLAKNSHRAVQDSTIRDLTITVSLGPRSVRVSFQDTGLGVADPERLFKPFQAGADGSGLGLYVSRAVIRRFGGDLRFEPTSSGACFCVELPIGGAITYEQFHD
jgi:two-component system, LuxR family, sensor kinase FixL